MFHGTVDNQVDNLKFLDDLGTGEPDFLEYDTRLKHDQVSPDSLAPETFMICFFFLLLEV